MPKSSEMFVSEIFGATIQGEGKLCGTPSVFIRFTKCNFSCTGFDVPYETAKGIKYGCDTYYAVDTTFKNSWKKYQNYSDIVNEVETIISNYNYKIDIVITGGEPLLYWDNDEFQKLLEYYVENGHKVTIETNASLNINFQKDYQKELLFSMSVKLSNSQESLKKRVNKPTLTKILENTKESYLKFVVGKDFIKEAKDMLKNRAVMLVFIIFPVLAFIMTEFVAKPNPEIPANTFVAQMAAIFAGMSLLTSASAKIAEDIENKSLRFLVMAGVKPQQYLLGVGGFMICSGIIVSIVFVLLGEFTTIESLKFLAVMILSIIASTTLGALIGVMSKNQQAATSLAMPAALILGFSPLIASFNKTVEQLTSFLFTQQLNLIVNDFSADFTKAILIIFANILVLAVAFIIIYKKKGFRI
jgi:organic radical activating enzyme